MKKRLIPILLMICMLCTMLPAEAIGAIVDNAATSQSTQSAAENPFADVEKSDWFYEGALYANLNGFFNGTSATTFSPNGSMTRAMFVTVLGRMAGVDTSIYSGTSTFADVSKSQYYAPYVAWAAKHGITKGVGNNKFNPGGLINREQMATFFVRYFELFDVNYQTGANISSAPADIDSIAPYARESVLKLWKNGLLNGDGVNYNPTKNASRAEMAVLSMRIDKIVETWYKEPGIPSERVSIDLTDAAVDPEPSKPSANVGNKTYYEVNFALGNGQPSVSMPAKSSYIKDTPITNLPTPSQSGMIFLGWYYDAELENIVKSGDVVQGNMTLYAKVAAGDAIDTLETPNYVTIVDQPTTVTFQISGPAKEADLRAALSFTQLTVGDPVVEYNVKSNGNGLWTITPTPVLKEGMTYQAELKNDSAIFVLSGEDQDRSVRYLNILTKKDEVTNASLNPHLKQIALRDTSIDDDVFNGLFQIDESGNTTRNNESGRFTYRGSEKFDVGDTLAICSEDADLEDVTSTEGKVAYVKVTDWDSASSSYSYEMADLDDVLFMPDILPISTADTSNNQITVSTSDMAAAMTTADASTLDAGDFIAFYTDSGLDGYQDETISCYGQITTFTASGDNYIISYTDATEDDIDSALDVYYEEPKDIELTPTQVRKIKKDIKEDVVESEFPQVAALYLSAVMMESDNLETVPDANQVSNRMTMMRSADMGTLTRAGGTSTSPRVVMNPGDINVKVSEENYISHLNGSGLKMTVEVPFKIIISDEVEINLTAKFEEDVSLSTKISTERIKLGRLQYDYKLSTSFVIGNYTGVQFTATIHTTNGGGVDESMSKTLDQIMERMKQYSNSNGVQGTNGDMESLSNIYQNVMDGANDAWLDIISVPMLEITGDVFFHVFCYQVKASFVVSANMCVSMGLSFTYNMKKQYSFSLQVKNRQSTNKTVDIISPRYVFDFYVIGTLGLRAGLRLEMYVGLFSLGVDKIGLTAEVGAYVRLWGYFFFHYSNYSGRSYSGAALIELGIYLDIKFVAQVLSSDTLTWNPTIYSHEWSLMSAGQRENVYAFDNSKDESLTMVNIRNISLPSNTFTMKYMDLKDGTISTDNKDDMTESNYSIAFTNPFFQYDPATNTISINRVENLVEETDMTISWTPAAIAFSSWPIQKVFHISFTCPADYSCIRFDPCGGTDIVALVAKKGDAVTWPANPTKRGYVFGGWYTDRTYETSYSSVNRMPDFPNNEEQGVTVYAKWIPATDTHYKVMHYQEALDGSYKRVDEDTLDKIGTTDSDTKAVANEYAGFTVKTFEQKKIQPNGSTVVEIYYTRNSYSLTFMFGPGVRYERYDDMFKYGDTIYIPRQYREGYTLTSWNPIVPETMPAEDNVRYTAEWTPNDNKIFFNLGGGGYSQTVRTGEKIAEPSTNPIQNGSVFAGWYKDETCITEWDFNTPVTGPTTLYAKWLTSNTINFNSNGGSSVADTTAVAGQKLTAPDDPTRTDYTFLGWYTNEECTTAWDFDSNTVTGPMTLYAKWEINKNTVQFNSLGGTEVNDAEVPVGQKVTMPDAPTKANATFGGWYTDESCTTTWNFDNVINESMTLYAKWTVAAGYCTITFDTRGHGIAPDPLVIQQGSTIPTKPADPDDEYYSLLGWYREPEYYNMWAFADETDLGYQIGYPQIGEDAITLYAKWEEKAGLWVDGVDLTTADMSDFPSGVNYSGWNNSLSLNNADISVDSVNAIGAIHYVGSGPLTIWLTGENTVYADTGTATDELYGIKSNNNLRFKGDGMLTVTTADNTTGKNAAIYCVNNGIKMELLGPTVNAKAGTANESYGIWMSNFANNPYGSEFYYGAGTLYATGHTKAMHVGKACDQMENSNIEILGSTEYEDADPNSAFEATIDIIPDPYVSTLDAYKSIKVTKANRSVAFFNSAGTFDSDELAFDFKLLTCDNVATYGELPTVPTKEGYTFDGWYTQLSGGDLVTADTIVTEPKAHTLVPHWTKN